LQHEVAARTGKTLAAPFVLNDLYHEYADSWRVPAKESLLSVCSDRKVETGIPTQTASARLTASSPKQPMPPMRR
jgi:hypothetical protein